MRWPRPRFTIRSMMISVALSALGVSMFLAWRWLHDHNAFLSVGPYPNHFFTISF
ncbi:hypothetical protein P12x_004669 [Tundrisphaera lichenicola]|uniref:hypothetical protein n=1 Tax=Tundrisphaera lichenicola TaxID=2029860 RepID=UPI003EB75454